jgi:hypothetical protein
MFIRVYLWPFFFAFWPQMQSRQCSVSRPSKSPGFALGIATTVTIQAAGASWDHGELHRVLQFVFQGQFKAVIDRVEGRSYE